MKQILFFIYFWQALAEASAGLETLANACAIRLSEVGWSVSDASPVVRLTSGHHPIRLLFSQETKIYLNGQGTSREHFQSARPKEWLVQAADEAEQILSQAFLQKRTEGDGPAYSSRGAFEGWDRYLSSSPFFSQLKPGNKTEGETHLEGHTDIAPIAFIRWDTAASKPVAFLVTRGHQPTAYQTPYGIRKSSAIAWVLRAVTSHTFHVDQISPATTLHFIGKQSFGITLPTRLLQHLTALTLTQEYERQKPGRDRELVTWLNKILSDSRLRLRQFAISEMELRGRSDFYSSAFLLGLILAGSQSSFALVGNWPMPLATLFFGNATALCCLGIEGAIVGTVPLIAYIETSRHPELFSRMIAPFFNVGRKLGLFSAIGPLGREVTHSWTHLQQIRLALLELDRAQIEGLRAQDYPELFPPVPQTLASKKKEAPPTSQTLEEWWNKEGHRLFASENARDTVVQFLLHLREKKLTELETKLIIELISMGATLQSLLPEQKLEVLLGEGN